MFDGQSLICVGRIGRDGIFVTHVTHSLPFLSSFVVVSPCLFSIKRQATGIWKCLRCKKVMAGGAYVLR